MLGLGLGSHKASALRSLAAKLLAKLRGRSTYYENNQASKDTVHEIDNYELLDKATILLTPTATSNARVHSVKTYTGDELVTNGDFDTDLSGWTNTNTHWQWSSGSAYHPLTTSFNPLKQDITNNVGAVLRITFDLTYVQGTAQCFYKNEANSDVSTAFTSSGSYTIITEPVKANTEINFARSLGHNTEFYIDNISVIDVSSDFDFDRASSATRINSSGLVEMVGRTLGSELMPSVATIVNVGGGSITQISSNSYSSTSDGTTGSSLRPKFDFNTTSGKTYKLVITPTGTITGTVNFDFYDGSSYLFQNYDFTTTKEIYFTDNGSVFGGFDGTKTYSIDSFTISVKEIIDTNNIPRISYDSNGDNGHILLEPTSTNEITYSEDFNNAYWSKTGSPTITLNYGVSPSGENNSVRIQGNSSTAIYHSGVFSATDARSIFVKATSGSGNIQLLTHNGNTDNVFSINENWQRVEINTSSSNPSLFYAVDMRGASTDIFDIEIWGAQLEALSYATSYIPTLTGSTETRATETATGAGSATLINSTEGVLYAEIARAENDTNAGIISLNDGSNSNLVSIYYFSNDKIAFDIISSSPPLSQSVTTSNTSNFNKIALKYKSGDIALWVNGVEVITRTETISLSGLNNLDFRYGNNTFTFYGKCKALAVFNEALSDDELELLTGVTNYGSFGALATANGYTII